MDLSLRPGTELTYEELCTCVERAIRESDYTQRRIARRVGVDESSVSRACTEAGPKFQRLQGRILEMITGCRIEERTRFVVVREEDPGAEKGPAH